MLSEVRFASLLAYSPRGRSDVSIRSRKIRDLIKLADAKTLAQAVAEMLKRLPASIRGEFFGPDAVLVPAPRSAPLKTTDALWPARVICEALIGSGLGRETRTFLARTEVEPKSAYAAPGQRPTVERHLETMKVEREIDAPERLTIVDDIVTKGATLLAAVSHIQTAFPSAIVRAFALLRTCGLVAEVEKIVDPVVTGRITYANGRLDRDP